MKIKLYFMYQNSVKIIILQLNVNIEHNNMINISKLLIKSCSLPNNKRVRISSTNLYIVISYFFYDF